MDVSVIMINYNTFEFTRDALDSIFAQTKGISYEIILVDNASPDGSGERLAQLFGGRIRYVQSGGNLGTSKAFNLGLGHTTGKYILWLNTDILFKENFMKELFDYMESDPQCGVCGGNLLDYHGRPAGSCRERFETIASLKRDHSIVVNLLRRLSRRQPHYNHSDKAKRVAWVNGAAMMIRRAVIEAIGGFDEVIFMYAEEEEFQYRMTQMTDYTVVSVPWAHMYHLENGSVMPRKKTYHEEWERLMLRGLPRFFYKWHGEKAVRQYLKLRMRAFRKLILIEWLLGKKEQRQRHQKMLALYREQLNDFQAYLSVLQGAELQTGEKT